MTHTTPGGTMPDMTPHQCLRTDDSMIPLTTAGRVNLNNAAAWRVDEADGYLVLRVTWPSLALTQHTLADDD
jgi:hypothetical protein